MTTELAERQAIYARMLELQKQQEALAMLARQQASRQFDMSRMAAMPTRSRGGTGRAGVLAVSGKTGDWLSVEDSGNGFPWSSNGPMVDPGAIAQIRMAGRTPVGYDARGYPIFGGSIVRTAPFHGRQVREAVRNVVVPPAPVAETKKPVPTDEELETQAALDYINRGIEDEYETI